MEIRQETIFWLHLAEAYLENFTIIINSDRERLRRGHISALQGQTALERAFKGLLAAGNDGTRFRRNAALMWRHIKGGRPFRDRESASAVESLLDATKGPGGNGCSLTRFTEAWRRGDFSPDPTETEWQAMARHLAPAVNALVTEALARSGATKDDMEQERDRRMGPGR